MRAVATILRKDLVVELRTKESVPSMALFATTTFVIFHFGLDRDRLEGELAAGVLWVTLLFAAILGINRLFVAEREQGSPAFGRSNPACSVGGRAPTPVMFERGYSAVWLKFGLYV